MRILVTGALGSIGVTAVRDLVAQGHSVRTFDLRTRANQRRSKQLAGRIDVRWGDIRDERQVADAVVDRDAVIHLAAILYPDSEQNPELSEAVNVGGTRNILTAMAASPDQPLLVFPSSIAVHGPSCFDGAARDIDDPISPASHYAWHKVECEKRIRSSEVPWTILRLGAAIEPGVSAKITPLALKTMFNVSLETRLEWIHPSDAGLALANAHALSVLKVSQLRLQRLKLFQFWM